MPASGYEGALVPAVVAVPGGSGRHGEGSPFAGQVVVAEPGCEFGSGAVLVREPLTRPRPSLINIMAGRALSRVADTIDVVTSL